MRDDPKSPTDEHRYQFGIVRDMYALAMDEAIATMEQLGVDTVFRAKNLGTVIEKLRRESVRLSQMDDIVGGRVKDPLDTLLDQDEMVERVLSGFDNTERPKDRRDSPSHGYRAVHVIAICAGRRVELQVRTRRQDAWAQLQERLADEWGREIKYGGNPADPSVVTKAGLPRQFIVETMLNLSESIRKIEVIERALIRDRMLPDDQREDLALEANEAQLEELDNGLQDLLDLVSSSL